MAVTKEKKKEMLADLISKMKEAKSVVFADFHGLSVKDLSKMRNELREKGVNFKVAKKTLVRIAAKEAGVEQELDEKVLEGTVGTAFSMDDEIFAARFLKDFAKKNKNLSLRGSIFEGKVLSVAETMVLASLPGKDELLAKLVYILKSPIQGFHGVLHNTMAGLVRVLNAVKEKQEKSA